MLATLPSHVERADLQPTGQVLRISGVARVLGLIPVSFQIDLAPSEVIWRSGVHQIVFRVRRFRPLDIRPVVDAALDGINALPGLAYRDRQVIADVEEMLGALPGWQKIPEAIKYRVRLKRVVMAEDRNTLDLVLGV